MNTALTYRELADIISKMTPEQQDAEIMLEDDGSYFKCNVGVLAEDAEDNEGNVLKMDTPYFFIPF